MKRLPLALLILCFSFLLPALAANGRYSVHSPLKLRDRVSGQEFTVPANAGFTYSIVEVAKGDSQVRVFDREGKEIQGSFTIPSQDLQEARAREITAGLKAVAEGPKGVSPGCCDVDKEAVNPLPAPAPAPAPAPVVSAPKLVKTTTIKSDPKPEAVEESRKALKTDSAPLRPEPPAVNTRRPAVVRPALVATPSPGVFTTPPWAADEASSPAPAEPPSRTGSKSSRKPHGQAASVRWEEGQGFVSEKDGQDRETSSPPSSFSGGGRYCALYRKFRGKVPDVPLRQILYYMSRDPNRESYARRIQNSSVISFADYSQPSEKERFYQLDLESGEVTTEKVSHGSGTCYYSGRERICSGGSNSMLKRCGTGNHYTRSGFYRIESTYYSSHGNSNGWPKLSRSRNGLRMRGLTPGVNWSSENDGIVMHEARYNNERIGAPMGRSNGCVAFAPGCLRRLVMDKDLAEGSLFYSYAPQCGDQMRAIQRQIAGWESFCR